MKNLWDLSLEELFEMFIFCGVVVVLDVLFLFFFGYMGLCSRYMERESEIKACLFS